MAEPSHLTDLDLQALLDQALDPIAERSARSHLAGCRECRRRAEALSRLFVEIESWEEESPPHDLTPAVMHLLKAPATPGGLRVATAVQAGLAAILTILAWPILTPILSSVQAPPLPTLDLGSVGGLAVLVEGWLRSALAAWASAAGWLHVPPQTMALWPAVIAGALLLAVLGNSILLGGGSGGRVRPRRSS